MTRTTHKPLEGPIAEPKPAGSRPSHSGSRPDNPSHTLAAAASALGARTAGAALPDTDGRQSEGALEIVRGCRRILAQLSFASLPELTLANGRRADLAAISDKGAVWIIEVKSSIADFESDAKWPEYLEYCDRLFFAVSPEFPIERLPEAAGWIVADRFGGEIIRDAPQIKLPAARRKAVHLAFARTAAMRLHRLSDPDGAADPLGVR